jgi:hypothetical protein
VGILGILLAAISVAAEELPKTLLGIPMEFKKLQSKGNLKLHTILVIPRTEEGGQFVVLSIDRLDLTVLFLENFFSPGSNWFRSHPFGSNGVEATLGKKEVRLKIHPGVALHLRQGIPNNPQFKTFATDKVRVRVVESRGVAYVSVRSKEVKVRAGNLYAVLFGKSAKNQKGQILPGGDRLFIGEPIGENDFPPVFVPQVE